MANTFTKKINIQVDTSAFKITKDKIDRSFENLDIKPLIEDNKALSDVIKKQIEYDENLKQVKGAISEMEKYGLKNTEKYNELLAKRKELNEALDQEDDDDDKEESKFSLKKFKENFKEMSVDYLKDLAKSFKTKMKDLFTDLLRSITEEFEKQTGFDSTGSHFSEDAYNQQMEYGLSDSENYALSKALERLNMSKDEYEMGGYNDKRAQLLQEYLDLYKHNYEEMKASGYLDNIAEMKDKFAEAKENIKQTIMKFIVDNGDIIMACLQGALSILQGIFKVLNMFNDAFGDGSQSSWETSQNVNNIIDNNTYKTNTSLSINNNMVSTASGVTNITQLKQAGNTNARQISRSLER